MSQNHSLDDQNGPSREKASRFLRVVSLYLKPMTVFLVVLAGCATTFQAGTSAGYAGQTAQSKLYAHYLAAAIYERRGQFEQAAEELRKAISIAPNDSSLQIALVRTYAQMADLDSALRACKEGIKKDPSNPMLWIWLGGICQRLERYDDAVGAYQRLIELQPGDPFWYDRLIRAAEQANDLVTLLDVFEKLVQMLPDSGQMRFQLGYYLVRVGNTERACTLIEEALALDPNIAGARNVLGLLYLDLNRNEEAAHLLQVHCDQVPDDASAKENLAGAYGRLGQFDKALAVLNGLVEQQPELTLGQIARRYVLMKLGMFREIIESPSLGEAPILSALFQIIARHETGNSYEDLLASLDSLEGDIDTECKEYLEKVTFLYGKESTSSFLIQKLKQLGQSTSLKSKRVATVLARLLMAAENDAEAEKVLLDGLRQFGSDKWLHLYLATIYEKQDKREETIEHLKKSLEIDPDDPEVMNFLGYFYADKNLNLDEAEALIKRALEIDPDNGYYLDSLGWVYFRKGDAERAIEYIRRAIVKMDNDDAVLRDHLGDAYALRGAYDKAVAEWRRALRLDPKLEGVQDKIDKALRKLK